jgi:hypothetical protein
MTTTLPNGHEMYQNGHTIFQTTIKYTNIFHSKALRNLPKFGLWFENTPSGNPAEEYYTLISPSILSIEHLDLSARPSVLSKKTGRQGDQGSML